MAGGAAALLDRTAGVGTEPTAPDPTPVDTTDLDAREPEGRPTGLPVQRLLADVVVPEAPPVDMPAQPDTTEVDSGSELQGAATDVQVDGQASGGGGVTDWLLSQATSAFRSLVGSVGGDARALGSAAGGALSGAAGGLFGGLSALASEVGSALSAGFSGLLTGHGGLLKGVVRAAKSSLRSVLHSAAGGLKGLQGAIKATLQRVLEAGAGNPLAELQSMVRNAIDKAIAGLAAAVSDKVAQVAASVGAALALIENLIGSIGPKIAAFVGRAQQVVNGALDRAMGLVTGFLRSATALAARLPSAVRSLVESLLARLRAAVERVAAGIRTIVTRIAGRITGLITRVTDLIKAAAARAKVGLTTIVQTVARNAERIIRSAIDIAGRIAKGIKTAADKVVEVALAAILPTLPKKLFDYAVEKLTPLLVAKILDAANIDLSALGPLGMPDNPAQITNEAGQLAQQTAARVPTSIAGGLLNPEGDHVAKGFYASGSWAIRPPAMVQANVSLTLDFVANYRTNKVAFFLTPGWAAGGGLTTGTGVGGDIGVTDAWGTVATFGADASGKPQDIDNFGGRFFNVGLAAGATVPVEGVPVAISSGSTFYTSGANEASTTPGTTTPPTTTPPTTTPPSTTPPSTTPPTTTPARPLGTFSVPFGNQSAVPTDLSSADAAAAAVRADLGSNAGASYSVDVVGHASNRWAAAGTDSERRDNNQSLSDQRAGVVASETGRRMAGLPVSAPSHRGIGVVGASGGATTNDPADRRADITPTAAAATRPGSTTPGTTTPGTTTPGTTTPGTTTPPTTTPATGPTARLGPLAVWGPQTRGGSPLAGWDTTRSVGVATSPEPSASAGLTVGNSYSYPLGSPVALSGTEMGFVRAVVGLYKISMDIMSASPLGFLRDTVGLFAPLLNANVDSAADGIVNAVIPIPDEELA
jgi:hypothetical protein